MHLTYLHSDVIWRTNMIVAFGRLLGRAAFSRWRFSRGRERRGTGHVGACCQFSIGTAYASIAFFFIFFVRCTFEFWSADGGSFCCGGWRRWRAKHVCASRWLSISHTSACVAIIFEWFVGHAIVFGGADPTLSDTKNSCEWTKNTSRRRPPYRLREFCKIKYMLLRLWG